MTPGQRNWWDMDTADMFIAVLGGMITRFSEFIRFQTCRRMWINLPPQTDAYNQLFKH